MKTDRVAIVAPVAAAVLIAQQVGSNAVRDGLLLSSYPVTVLPYFVSGAALVALPAATASGRLNLRFGPSRVAPALLAASAALFATEWALLAWPRAVAVLLYLHSSVLGALAVSAFWSLLNERFDPHAAKVMMARVSGAATLGGLAGGVAAARIAAAFSTGGVLLALTVLGAVSLAGAQLIGRGPSSAPRSTAPADTPATAWTEVRRNALLRDLAIVTALTAGLGSLVDYLMKAQAVAWLGQGPGLVRFFGLFYASTGVAAFLLQATAGRFVLSRLGLGGSVASHPVAVGAAGLLGIVIPAPWSGILPRAVDQVVRNSVGRAGYELLYTPLPPAAKRTAKSLIDVTADSVGKGGGAALIVLLTRVLPLHVLAAVNLAGVAVAAAAAATARRLRPHYVAELEGGLRRHGGDPYDAAQASLSDFTMVRSVAGMDSTSLRQLLGESRLEPPAPQDPVVAALADLRSRDTARIRLALATLPRDPALIATLIPLLDDARHLRAVLAALSAFGARAAGEMVSALFDPATPEAARRRLPFVLKSCDSPIARDGLVAALDASSFEVRSRSAKALLALTDSYPHLPVPAPSVLAAAEGELARGDESAKSREHVFDLLALAFEREPVLIAARAFRDGDAYVRGTSLEYLETVLPPNLFAGLRPRLAAAPAPVAASHASAAELRDELVRAGATMTISLDDVRRQLAAAGDEDLLDEDAGGTR